MLDCIIVAYPAQEKGNYKLCKEKKKKRKKVIDKLYKSQYNNKCVSRKEETHKLNI